jgi:hypothetical protein
MTMRIKERKFLFMTKSKLKKSQAPKQKIGRELLIKKVGQAQLAGKPMLAAYSFSEVASEHHNTVNPF